MDPNPLFKKLAQLNKAIEYIAHHLAQRTAGAEYIQECIAQKTDGIVESTTKQINKMYDSLENDKEKITAEMEQMYMEKYNLLKREYAQAIKKHYHNQKSIETTAKKLLENLSQFSNEVVPELIEGMKNFEKDDTIDPQIYIDMIKKKVEEHELAIKIHDENANKKLEAFRKAHSINEEMFKSDNQVTMQLPVNFRRLPARLRSSYKDFLKDQKSKITDLKGCLDEMRGQISGIQEKMKENLTFMKANVKRTTRQMHIEDKKRSDSKLQTKKTSQNQDDSMKSEINHLSAQLKQIQRDLDFNKYAILNELKAAENENKELKENIINMKKKNEENNPELDELRSKLSKEFILFIDDKNKIEKDIQKRISNIQDSIKIAIESKVDTTALDSLKAKNSNNESIFKQKVLNEIEEIKSVQSKSISEEKRKLDKKQRLYHEYQNYFNEKNLLTEQKLAEKMIYDKQKREREEIRKIKDETPHIVRNEIDSFIQKYNETKDNKEKELIKLSMSQENEIIQHKEILYNKTVQEIKDFPKRYEEIPEIEIISQEYSEMISILIKENPFLAEEDLISVQNLKVELIKRISKEKINLIDSSEEKYSQEIERHKQYLKDLATPGLFPKPFFVIESAKQFMTQLDRSYEDLQKEMNKLKEELRSSENESCDEEIDKYRKDLEMEKEKSKQNIKELENEYCNEKAIIESNLSKVIQENNDKDKISYDLIKLNRAVLNQELAYLMARDFSLEGNETLFSKVDFEYENYKNEKYKQIQEIKRMINAFAEENRIQREKIADDNDCNFELESENFKKSINEIKAKRDLISQEYDKQIMELREKRAKQRLNPPPRPIKELEEELEEKEYNLSILENELEGMKTLIKNRPPSEASDIEKLKPIVAVKSRPKTSLAKRPIVTTPNL